MGGRQKDEEEGENKEFLITIFSPQQWHFQTPYRFNCEFCFQNSSPIFTFCPSVLCHSGHPQNFLAASLSIVICKDLDLGES